MMESPTYPFTCFNNNAPSLPGVDDKEYQSGKGVCTETMVSLEMYAGRGCSGNRVARQTGIVSSYPRNSCTPMIMPGSTAPSGMFILAHCSSSGTGSSGSGTGSSGTGGTNTKTCSGSEMQLTPAKNGVTETCCVSCKDPKDTCATWLTAVTKGGCASKCTFTPTQLAADQLKRTCTAAQIKTVSDDYAARKASEPSPGGQGGTVPEPPSTPKCGPNAKVPCVDNGAIVNVFTTSDCTGKSKGFD